MPSALSSSTIAARYAEYIRGQTGVVAVRKVLGFAIAAALFGAGVYLLCAELFVAPIIMGRMVVMGGFLAFLGGAWLWSDLHRPAIWARRRILSRRPSASRRPPALAPAPG